MNEMNEWCGSGGAVVPGAVGWLAVTAPGPWVAIGETLRGLSLGGWGHNTESGKVLLHLLLPTSATPLVSESGRLKAGEPKSESRSAFRLFRLFSCLGDDFAD